MSCERVNPTFSASDMGRTKGCIFDTLRRIEQLQKEHLKESDCVGCGGPLIAKIFDTKPVLFTLCNDEKFTAYLGLTPERTDLFRVEEVMRDCVLLRLLKREGGCVRCTKFTTILNLDCICALQCFEPINCRIDRKENCNFED